MKPAELSFSHEAADMFDKIAAIWPLIIRQGKKDKILLMLSLLAHTRKIKKVDAALVVEATRLVVPKSYDPLFHMFEDMEAFKKRMLDPFMSEAAYNKIPVRVRRWPYRPPRKKAAAKEVKNILAVCASPRAHGNTDMLTLFLIEIGISEMPRRPHRPHP